MTKRFTPSSLLILKIKFVSEEYLSRLMKVDNLKLPSNYSSRKSVQVCSSMLPLFPDKFKIHNTHHQGIKNQLLKANNK